jgi:hypothetical protein
MNEKSHEFNDLPNLMIQLHREFFITNQKLDMIQKIDTKFKDKFYDETYNQLAMSMRKLGVIMRDTEQVDIFTREDYGKGDEAIVVYRWDRNLPQQLIEVDRRLNRQSYSEVLGLKPYAKKDLVGLVQKLEPIVRGYYNVHTSFIGCVVPDIVHILDILLTAFLQDLEELKVLAKNNHSILIFCEDDNTYLWDLLSPTQLENNWKLYNDYRCTDIYLNDIK